MAKETQRIRGLFYCPDCGQSFKKSQYRDQHMKFHEPSNTKREEQRYTCDWPDCTRGFKYFCQREKHYETHLDLQAFICNCGTSFTRVSDRTLNKCYPTNQ